MLNEVDHPVNLISPEIILAEPIKITLTGLLDVITRYYLTADNLLGIVSVIIHL